MVGRVLATIWFNRSRLQNPKTHHTKKRPLVRTLNQNTTIATSIKFKLTLSILFMEPSAEKRMPGMIFYNDLYSQNQLFSVRF